jgi:hypothetical protein
MTFVENDKESRIITTTRKHEVAGKAGGGLQATTAVPDIE